MLSDNDDNGCQKVIDPRKILSPSKFGLVLDKFEIQRLIREESKRVSLKENEHGSSQAWDNFRIVVLDGVPLDFVCCNRCLAVYKYSSNAGTTGLNRHRKLCQGTSTPYFSLTSQLLGQQEDDDEADEEIDINLEQLIASVKIRPDLYESTEQNVRTESIWSIIALEVGKNSDWCKSSWQSLVEKYAKVKARSNYIDNNSCWIYMNLLDFLNHTPAIESRLPTETSPIEPAKIAKKKQRNKRPFLKEERFDPGNEIHISSDSYNNFFNEGDTDFDNGTSEVQPEVHNNSSKQRKLRHNYNDKDLWTINLQHQDSRKLDKHDLFCMALAAQMRSLPSVHASNARLKISEVMHSIELEVEGNESIPY